MIRDLMSPESHDNPYVWSAVLLAHAALGVAGWAIIGWWAVMVYLAFELVQAITARGALWWDSVLDACGFICGALLASSMWARDLPMAATAILVCACICFSGAMARRMK